MNQRQRPAGLMYAVVFAAMLALLAACGRADPADYPLPLPHDASSAYPGPLISPEEAALGTPYPLPPVEPSKPGPVIMDYPAQYLGVAVDPNTNSVVSVDRYGPADGAGIHVGDVLLEVKGQPVGERLSTAKRLLAEDAIIVPFTVTFERDGAQQTLMIDRGSQIIPTSNVPLPTITPLPEQYVYL